MTRRHGVVSTTTGPGTFNTLSALAEAWSDSSPVVLLGGQIDSTLLGLGKGILHETVDQGRSFEAVTAFVGRPRSGRRILAAVAEALRCAMTGRNRPAYVELPTDLLDLPHPGATPAVTLPGPVAVDASEVVAAARLLAGARRPLLVPGQGVLRADAAGALRRLAGRLTRRSSRRSRASGRSPPTTRAGRDTASGRRPRSRCSRRLTRSSSSACDSTTWRPDAGRCRSGT